MLKVLTFYISLYFNCYLLLVDCNESHSIRNRQAGYQMCTDTFDIYEDKIIRTQDSKELGAKYISERDVPSREDCYQLCCDTDKCDVFVFEEKRPGSCYLFECGPPDDFHCKFTKHRNYTSGVSKHMSELETQIKFTQHEHELTNLRDPDKNVKKIEENRVIKTSTTTPPGSKETLQLVPQETKHIDKPVEKCNRFSQFECHTSHECIAIYNACDGVPQCADGSDEAPELDCPKQPILVAVTKEPTKPLVVTSSPMLEAFKSKEQSDKSTLPAEPKSQPEKVPSQQQYSHQTASVEKVGDREVQPAPIVNNFQNANPQRQSASPNTRLAYGREGEGMAYRSNPDSQWMYNDRNYHQNPQGPNGQIFNHKGNGIITQNERYPPPHNFPDNPAGSMGYNNEQPSNEYMRYNYYENPQYRLGPPNQYNNQAAWQAMHKTGDDPMMKNDRYPNGMMPQEFYYDENSYRGRAQMMDNRQPMMDNRQSMIDNKQPIMDNRQMMMNSQQHVGNQPMMAGPPQPISQARLQAQTAYENRAHMELTNLAKSSKEEELKNSKNSLSQVTSTIPTTTAKPKYVKEERHHQLSHIKIEKLTADAAFAPSEIDGHNSSPSGAILSLTFGLLITALMVVLVGCRIRTVRRRLRRGGKTFAHDADFLVNGMYL